MGKSETKAMVYPMRLSDADVGRLEELQEELRLDSFAQVWRHLLHHSTVISRPQVRVDSAILQPPVQHQVEADRDCVWA